MRALLIGSNDLQLRKMRELINRAGFTCAEADVVPVELAAEVAGRLRRDLIAICWDAAGVDLAQIQGVVRDVRSASEGTMVVAGPASDPKVILGCLHEGADEFIDIQSDDVAIERLLQRQRSNRKTDVVRGSVICVVGAVGGAGVSTIAANLSVGLVQRRRPTLLIDMGMKVNDQATLLDIKPRYSLGDLCSRENRLDATMLEQSLVSHTSGVRCLSALGSPSSQQPLTCEGIRRCLSVARSGFDHIVVDVDRMLSVEQIALLVRADWVLVVVRPDVLSLRNAERLLVGLDGLGVRPEQIRLVGSQFGQPHGVSQSQFEESLDSKFLGKIAYDQTTANLATSAGVPALQLKPRSSLARDIQQLTETLISLSVGGAVETQRVAGATARAGKLLGVFRRGWSST